MKRKLIFVVFFTFIQLMAMADEPLAVYLTWRKDPHETMVVQWISLPNDCSSTLYYRKASDNEWVEQESLFIPLPKKSPASLHRIELTGLDANKEYLFRIGKEAHIYKFQTLPKILDQSIKFIVGGDIFKDDEVHYKEMNKLAASYNPRFVVWGGDLAYAASKYFSFLESADSWLKLLSIWSKTMITKEGHLIPLIAVIGNHDVNGRYTKNPSYAPFYYALFPTPGYQVLDIGNFLSLFLLDSGHTHPVAGVQTEWLRSSLQARQNVPFKFACYHVPAFPSVRSYHNSRCSAVRKNWVPLFEQYHLQTAFENHDHAYKRSHLIKNGKIDKEGVLYLGDGGWSVPKIRKPRTPSQSWYIAKSLGISHFIAVTLHPDFTAHYQAINHLGQVFDDFYQKAQ